jgi:hypothetical protein
MHYSNETEINDLLNLFIEKRLPKEKWTHEAHLTAAIWHLVNHDFYEAVCLIKSRIISYNLAVGGENTSTSGYHETITVFWMKWIALFLEQNKNKSLLEVTNQFLRSSLALRSVTEHFYEKEKLMSTEARSIFIEPNKKEISAKAIKLLLTQNAN